MDCFRLCGGTLFTLIVDAALSKPTKGELYAGAENLINDENMLTSLLRIAMPTLPAVSRDDAQNFKQCNAIRQRMHEDGHFIIPVIVNVEDENQFTFRTIQTNDQKLWHVVFTSQDEFTKGEYSAVISHFIDSTLQFCLQTEATGYIINPWGQSFLLTIELIQMIYEADGGVEYTVPDETITEELLEDGSFLKKAIEICNRNRTQLNLIKC